MSLQSPNTLNFFFFNEGCAYPFASEGIRAARMLVQSKKRYVSFLLRSKQKYCIQGSIPLRAREGTLPGKNYSLILRKMSLFFFFRKKNQGRDTYSLRVKSYSLRKKRYLRRNTRTRYPFDVGTLKGNVSRKDTKVGTLKGCVYLRSYFFLRVSFYPFILLCFYPFLPSQNKGYQIVFLQRERYPFFCFFCWNKEKIRIPKKGKEDLSRKNTYPKERDTIRIPKRY